MEASTLLLQGGSHSPHESTCSLRNGSPLWPATRALSPARGKMRGRVHRPIVSSGRALRPPEMCAEETSHDGRGTSSAAAMFSVPHARPSPAKSAPDRRHRAMEIHTKKVGLARWTGYTRRQTEAFSG